MSGFRHLAKNNTRWAAWPNHDADRIVLTATGSASGLHLSFALDAETRAWLRERLDEFDGSLTLPRTEEHGSGSHPRS